MPSPATITTTTPSPAAAPSPASSGPQTGGGLVGFRSPSSSPAAAPSPASSGPQTGGGLVGFRSPSSSPSPLFTPLSSPSPAVGPSPPSLATIVNLISNTSTARPGANKELISGIAEAVRFQEERNHLNETQAMKAAALAAAALNTVTFNASVLQSGDIVETVAATQSIAKLAERANATLEPTAVTDLLDVLSAAIEANVELAGRPSNPSSSSTLASTINEIPSTVRRLSCLSNVTTGSSELRSTTGTTTTMTSSTRGQHIAVASFEGAAFGTASENGARSPMLTVPRDGAPARTDLLGRSRPPGDLDPPVGITFTSSPSSSLGHDGNAGRNDSRRALTLLQFSGKYSPFWSSPDSSSDALQVVETGCRMAATGTADNVATPASVNEPVLVLLNFSLERTLAVMGGGAAIAERRVATDSSWPSGLISMQLEKVCDTETGTVRNRRPADDGIRLRKMGGSKDAEKKLWCATWDPVAGAFSREHCRVRAVTNSTVECECAALSPRQRRRDSGQADTFAVVDYTLLRIADSFSLITPFSFSWPALLLCGGPLLLYAIAMVHAIATQPRRSARRAAGTSSKRAHLQRQFRSHAWVSTVFAIKRFEDVEQHMEETRRSRTSTATPRAISDPPSRDANEISTTSSSSTTYCQTCCELCSYWWQQMKASHEILAPFLAAEGPGMCRIHFLTNLMGRLSSVTFCATALFYLYSCSSWFDGVSRGGVTTAEWWLNKLVVIAVSLAVNRAVSFPATWAFARNEALAIALDNFQYRDRLRHSVQSSKGADKFAGTETSNSHRQCAAAAATASASPTRFYSAVRRVQNVLLAGNGASGPARSDQRAPTPAPTPTPVRCCVCFRWPHMPFRFFPWFPFFVAFVQVSVTQSFVIILTGKGFLGAADNKTAAIYVGGGDEGTPCVCSIGDRDPEVLLHDWVLLTLMIMATWTLVTRPFVILLGASYLMADGAKAACTHWSRRDAAARGTPNAKIAQLSARAGVLTVVSSAICCWLCAT